MSLCLRVLGILSIAGQVACAATERPPLAAAPPPPVTWLCRPGAFDDACATMDPTATELDADGTRVLHGVEAKQEPSVDCFYVYPTVDFELVPGNHRDLSDRRNVVETTRAQVARFRSTCALWVPLYRQVTLGTWLRPKPELEKGLAFAYADVERAFAEYLAQAPPGRRVVLIGHSQGAEMVVRLLRRFFEFDPALRARLLLAVAVGGSVDVAVGSSTGGTLGTLPLCTRPLETACVVAYRSHAAGERIEPGGFGPHPGRETACVDPTRLDHPQTAEALLTVYPAAGVLEHSLRGVADLHTPFVELNEHYDARCVNGVGGYRALEIAARGVDPLGLHDRRMRSWKLGLHVLDLQLPQGNLIELVSRRLVQASR